MRDRKWILTGLVVFVAVALFPVWYGALAGKATAPNPPLPTNSSSCIEPTQWMIANHPGLLNSWRNEVVRQGLATFVSPSGKDYPISFPGTCFSCHQSGEAFCQTCHSYADVHLSCWECHVQSGGSYAALAGK